MRSVTDEDDLSRVTSLAFGLSPEDQAILIFRLEKNLLSIKPDPEVEAAWDAEIERRLRQVEAGEVELIDHEVVMKQLRDRLGLH